MGCASSSSSSACAPEPAPEPAVQARAPEPAPAVAEFRALELFAQPLESKPLESKRPAKSEQRAPVQNPIDHALATNANAGVFRKLVAAGERLPPDFLIKVCKKHKNICDRGVSMACFALENAEVDVNYVSPVDSHTALTALMESLMRITIVARSCSAYTYTELCDPNTFYLGARTHATALSSIAMIAKLLLEKGADPNVQHGPKDFTPLMTAAFCKCLPLVKLLLQFNASAHLVSKVTHQKAIDLCRDSDIAQLLLAASSPSAPPPYNNVAPCDANTD